MQKKLYIMSAAGLLALTLACDKHSSPAAPTPAATSVQVDAAASADGSTLKVPPPTLVSPANGATAPDFTIILKLNPVTAKFVNVSTFAYHFQLLLNSQVVREFRTSSATQWAPDELDSNVTYSWRARAESGTYFGPWSDTWTFKTPDVPKGYIKTNEVYDPLTDGTTVGEIHGPVTLIPKVGAKMEDLVSYIQYRMPDTVIGGEISLLATNVHGGTQGGKTKVMAMSQGLSDITTNPRRFTIEKRGEPENTIAWRVITNCERIETVGGERVERNFDPNRWYLWTASYGNGNFNLTIREDGPDGNVIYSFGKPYCGVYNPDPMFVFAGGPQGRAGPDAGTVPGMIVKQFWMSNRPRPAFANK